MNSEGSADSAWTPRPTRRRGRHGFTTVELMIALGLVAVLATLSVNAWGGWRERVNMQKAQDDIIAISVVVDQYWQDKQGYPASLAAIGRDAMRDPWGNPYRYLNLTTANGNGQARKDHSLVPLNSDYDLYSMGPDGRSASPLTAQSSRDDVLRANNGRFVGPASAY
jgi:general secretion pathway protein G